MQDNIYWSVVQFQDWNVLVAATDQGLCFVGSNNGSFSELEQWGNRCFSSPLFTKNDYLLQPYARELKNYLQGKLTEFTIPTWYKGTAFQEEVWQALTTIPYGQTYSYSQIADSIGKPNAVRAVGAAIGANPLLITIPCHRVIGKNGALTGYRGGIEMKTKLLHIEQILHSHTASEQWNSSELT